MSKRNTSRRFKKTSINKQFKQQEQEGRQEGRKEEEGGMGIKKCLKFCKNTGGNEEMKKRRNEEMKKARNEKNSEAKKDKTKTRRNEETKKGRQEAAQKRRNEETKGRNTEKKKRQHIPTCATVLSSSSIVCYEHSPPDALLVSKRHYL